MSGLKPLKPPTIHGLNRKCRKKCDVRSVVKNCSPRGSACIVPVAAGRGVFEAKSVAAINVRKELENLREEVMYCFRITYPDRVLADRLILELVKMGLLERGLKKTDNLNERKEIFEKFLRSKTAIEYWVVQFKQSRIRKPGAEQIEQAFGFNNS